MSDYDRISEKLDDVLRQMGEAHKAAGDLLTTVWVCAAIVIFALAAIFWLSTWQTGALP